MRKSLLFLLPLLVLLVVNNQAYGVSPNYLHHATMMLAGEVPSAPPIYSQETQCGQTLLTEATPPSDVTYYWQGSNSNGTDFGMDTWNYPTYAATSSGYYYVRAHNSAGWSACAGVWVTVKVSPVPTASNNGPICEGSTLALVGEAWMKSYSWSGPNGFSSSSQSPVVSYSAATAWSGTYTLTVTDYNDCPGTITTTVTVNGKPSVSASNNGPVCVGNQIAFTGIASSASGIKTYSWNGPGFSSLLASPTTTLNNLGEAGTYTLTVTDNNNCVNAATTNVGVNPLPTAGISPSTAKVCAGSSLGMNGNPSGGTAPYSHAWTGSGASSLSSTTAVNPSFSNSTAGTYGLTYTVTDNKGCKGASGLNVTVNAKPIPAPVNSGPICQGGTLAMVGEPATMTSYSWTGSGISGTSSSQSPTISTSATPAMSGVYTLTITDGNGCTNSATTTATVYGTPAVSASNNGPVCENTQLSLSSTAGMSTYSWRGPNSFTNSGQNPVVSTIIGLGEAGTYNLTVTDAHGCTNSTSTDVTINPAPVAVISPSPAKVCAGLSLGMNGNPSGGTAPYSHAWTGNGASSLSSTTAVNPSFSNSTAGTYGLTYTVTDNKGCKGASGLNVTVNAKPIPAPVNSGPICQGGTLAMVGEPAAMASYSWIGPGISGSSSSQSPTISTSATPAMSGVYTLTITDGNGCVNSATTTATVYGKPAASASNNGPICLNNQVGLTASPNGLSYSWTGPGGFGSTVQNPTPTLSNMGEAGTYTLTVKDNHNCTNTATTDVVVNPLPTPTASNSGPVCAGGTLALTGEPGSNVTYLWTGPGFSSTSQSPTVSAGATTAMSGTYTLTVKDINTNCQQSATTAVTVNNLPVPIPTNSGPICEGSTLKMTGEPNGMTAYSWTGPGSFTSNQQSPTIATTGEAGTYTLQVTDGNGCKGLATTAVVVNAIPVITNVTEASVAGEGSMTLSVSASSGTIKWYGENTGTDSYLISGATYTTPTINTTTTYYVDVTANGCTTPIRTGVKANVIPAQLDMTAETTSQVIRNTLKSAGESGNIPDYYISPDDGTLTINTGCNTTWSVTSYPSGWLTGMTLSGDANQSAVFAFKTNVNPVTVHNGKIIITSFQTSKSLVVEQSSYSISASLASGSFLTTNTMSGQGEVMQYDLPLQAGSFDLNYNTNTSWTVTSSDPTWLTLASNTLQSTGESVEASYTQLDPTITQSRSAALIFTKGSYAYTINVSQDMLFAGSYKAPALTKDYNYIYTIQPNIAVQNIATGTFPQIKQVSEQVTYLDGLGRPMEDIQMHASPNNADIVIPHVYDNLGRESLSYMPFEYINGGTVSAPINASPGRFVGDPSSYTENPIAKQINFYTAQYPSDGSYAYSEKQFDGSPLNRVTAVISPGMAWKTADGNGNNHQNRFNEYPNNKTVNCYVVDQENGYTISGFLSSTTMASYGENTLWVKESKGENWVSGDAGVTKEYTNNSGHVVLKEVGLSDNDWLQTYYIYDDYGRLRCTVPPVAKGDFTKTAYCYYYAYDDHGRMVQKYVPGTGSTNDYTTGIVYMVYDKRNRLVATQDANQRAQSPQQWTFIKYDELNRPVILGTFGCNDGQSTVQSNANSYLSSNLYETRGNSLDRYTNVSFPTNTLKSSGESPLSTNDLLTIDYYDSYGSEANSFNTTAYSSYLSPGQTLTNLTGLVTTEKTKLLNSSAGLNDWEVSSIYYDNYGRILQSNTTNHMGGTTLMGLKYYGITNQVLQKVALQSISGGTALTINHTYNYNNAGYLLNEYHQIGNNTNQLVAAYTYNSLGQVQTEKMHQFGDGTYMQAVDFSYNIRGWLTAINSPTDIGTDVFAMRLYYNDASSLTGLSTVPSNQFNGTIGGMIWKNVDVSSDTKGYGFQYDNVNRLQNAYYGEGSTLGTNKDSYNEFGINYDANGNIKSLSRNCSGTLIDQLTYQYENNNASNHLSGIVDGSNSPDGYMDTQKSLTGDYSYDYNGNLNFDKNKGITAIKYNLLNLPQEIDFGVNNKIIYTYNAAGEKIRKDYTNNGSTSSYYYLNGAEYGNDMALTQFSFSEGLVQVSSSGGSTIYDYQYFIKDNLGNTRAVLQANNSGKNYTIMQSNDYYPFGMTQGKLNMGVNSNHYLFNGKEYQDDALGSTNLALYDYEGRFYDQQTGRFAQVDPLAENTNTINPYNYCYNNPVNVIDPSGMTGYWTIDLFLNYGDNTTSFNINQIWNMPDGLNQQIVTVYLPDGSVNSFVVDGGDNSLSITSSFNSENGILSYSVTGGPYTSGGGDFPTVSHLTGSTYYGKDNVIAGLFGLQTPIDYSPGEIREWKPSLAESWSMNESFAGKTTYDIADGFWVAAQTPFLGPDATHIGGQQVSGMDRATAVIGTIGFFLPGGEEAKAAEEGANIFGKEIANSAIRMGRDGKAVEVLFKDGSKIDINAARVKEWVPNTHPSAPKGTLQKLKFENFLPGSKGYKRSPTQEELNFLNSLK